MWGVIQVIASGDSFLQEEENLLLQIEAVRGQLHRKVGDTYDWRTMQAANGVSAHLDKLINKYLVLRAKKRGFAK